MGLLARGQDYLNRTLGAAAGVQVAYVRGALSANLTPWVGRTVFRQEAGKPGGASVVFGERDYLVPVAALVLGGAPLTPLRGDQIVETIGGASATFEVMAPSSGEPDWRYSDQTRTVYRLHVKRVA